MNLERIADAVASAVGKKMTVIRRSVSQIACAIVQLDERMKALEQRQPERGEKGEPDRDSDPVDLDALADSVVAKLLSSDRMATLADLAATKAVADYFEANPVACGEDGKDGVGLADALIDRDGALVLTMTDGRAKVLGRVVGQDGLSMADVAREYDPEAHEIVERWTVAGKANELRYPAGGIRPGGFWREGMKCLAAQAITHDGALWIAKRDTAAKPCLENKDDWQLAARKGRDGRDGKDGKPPPGPVKLGGGDA